MLKDKIVAIDFDGTITVKSTFPEIAEIREHAKEAINKIAENNTVCIWTCRDGEALEAALNALNNAGIKYHCVNASPCDNINPNARKIITDYFIDDRNIFAEIDWYRIEKFFMEND